LPIDALDYNIDYVGRFLIDGYHFEDILERTINPFRNQHGLASLSRDEIDIKGAKRDFSYKGRLGWQ